MLFGLLMIMLQARMVLNLRSKASVDFDPMVQ